MYRLHIANKNYSSWSLRSWVLMRELGILFEERLTPFETGPNSSPFREFSPTGLVPCLIDGDTAVWESLAIVEYLAERHDGVWPEDGAARAWARCASAEMHAGFIALRQRCAMNCGIRARLTDVPASLHGDLTRLDELWSDGIARFGGPFLAGPAFTAVDAFFAPVAFRIQSYDIELGELAMAYSDRLLELSAMQQWYREALREPWRDPAHEAEVSEFATLLEDRRTHY
ncbi:glutathione S-transferase [Litchfieldella qijiaojingensis]|uniref:Glutathione S-transferase n=1 Tax=Litchfieldella qijiaojingensis TaxID=980347 RepID=A0ABQ2YU66_9GAMM|nr:glutathione S-transferase family protein [Halomonas qijiaojingensis]GGX95507.1 glutathione S-transferase [Halomonas qijiaojingensis]